MNDPLVYLSVNGQEDVLPLSEARIPVLDRGFIFGDGIYEVVPVYQGVPFRMTEHLQRLARSLQAIGIENPHDDAGWRQRIGALMAAQTQTDQLVYLQVTRGVARRAHAFPKGVVPTVFMMSSELVLPALELRQSGVSAVTAPDVRWLRCDIKSISLLGNVLAAQHAAQHGVAETIMLREGFLSEGSSTNVWVVKNGTLVAPPLDGRILEGIRYGLIVELAKAHAMPLEIRPISEVELRDADELMLSSATKEVLAVVRLDGKAIGRGSVGPFYQKFHQWYQEAKCAAIAAAAAR